MLPVRKHPRLGRDAYATVGAVCSITIALRDRCRRFADPTLAAPTIDLLCEHAAKTRVTVFGYCLMPDHVHLLLSPSVDCDLVTFVGQFKNLAQRCFWRAGGQGLLWQKSFWDHFLRADEDVAVVLDYILKNPVRAGLVERWQDYPFVGSLVFTLR